MITGKAKSWFETYFIDRYQRVQLPKELYFSSWEKITNGVPQGSILGPLLFLIYINDLPTIMNEYTIPILFADDTSIIVKGRDPIDLQKNMENIFDQINDWFKTNLLTINMDKTNYIQFRTKNKPTTHLTITSNNQPVTPVSNIKFLGLYINDSLNWNQHIDYISTRLSTVCYIMRNIKSYMTLNTMITVYYSYFNSIISYGLLFWGISPYSQKIFRIQKKILRIMVGCASRTSCRSLFKKLGILPLASQYIYLLMLFVVNNMDLFKFNSATAIITTRQSTNLHQSSISLSICQKGVHCMGVRIYNKLPFYIKKSYSNLRKFKNDLKDFLHTNNFYSIEEYFQLTYN